MPLRLLVSCAHAIPLHGLGTVMSAGFGWALPLLEGVAPSESVRAPVRSSNPSRRSR